MTDVLADLRALLALEWETIVYAPEDGWTEAVVSDSPDPFLSIVDQLSMEAKEEAWHDCADTTREVLAVPQRRLVLEWHVDEVDSDGDPVRDWANGVVVEHPNLHTTLTAAVAEIERLRAEADVARTERDVARWALSALAERAERAAVDIKRRSGGVPNG